jgi:hypothetical protein
VETAAGTKVAFCSALFLISGRLETQGTGRD